MPYGVTHFEHNISFFSIQISSSSNSSKQLHCEGLHLATGQVLEHQSSEDSEHSCKYGEPMMEVPFMFFNVICKNLVHP